jgi:hypothetical protein
MDRARNDTWLLSAKKHPTSHDCHSIAPESRPESPPIMVGESKYLGGEIRGLGKMVHVFHVGSFTMNRESWPISP